jgi:hypothetical protein
MATGRSLFWAEAEGSLTSALARLGPVSRSGPRPAPPFTLPSATPSAPEVAPGFTPPYGSLEDRIEAWLQWVAGRAGAPNAFLLDRDGLPMLQLGGDTRLVELASLARSLFGRLGEAVGSRGRLAVSIRLDQDRSLRLVELSCPLGLLTIGFVQRDASAAAFETGLRGSLDRCFAEGDGTAAPAVPTTEPRHAD